MPDLVCQDGQLVVNALREHGRFATASQTDRQTDDSITPIADHTACVLAYRSFYSVATTVGLLTTTCPAVGLRVQNKI